MNKGSAAFLAAGAVIGQILGSYFIVPPDLSLLKIIAVVGTITGSIVGAAVREHYRRPAVQITVAVISGIGFLVGALWYRILIERNASGTGAVILLGVLMFGMFGAMGCLLQTAGLRMIDQEKE